MSHFFFDLIPKFLAALLFLFCPILGAKPPEEFYKIPKVVAVQNRPYYTNKDLTLGVGWLPSDAFNKGYSLGGSYKVYFLDYLGWEVINANYVINTETNLKKEFERLNIDVQSEGFSGIVDYMNYYVLSSLVYTPFYNKSLLFNDKVVHGNTSLVLGGGVAGFNETGTRLMISGGLLLKFYTEKNRSWTFDFRNNIYFEETLGAVYALTVGLGYSFELGSPPQSK